MKKKALITGISGQDGAYLSKLLLEKGYKVYGLMQCGRKSSLNRLSELGILRHINFVEDELIQIDNISRILTNIKPDELYNLSGQSNVQKSWTKPSLTLETNSIQSMKLLEAIRLTNINTKYFQAASSEIFGNVKTSPQNESTKINPDNPYGISKACAHWYTSIYRNNFGLYCCSGILYNHESPLRSADFVTRKITLSLAKILHGQLDVLELGNVDALRDWGFAGDYVQGMWLMMQHNTADDYILATGKLHSVREFVELACEAHGISIEWIGQEENSIAINKSNGRILVKINNNYYRIDDKLSLVGDSSKAKTIIKWSPTLKFQEIVSLMAKADYDRVKNGNILV